MYWFPLPFQLPVVIWPVQCWKRHKTPNKFFKVPFSWYSVVFPCNTHIFCNVKILNNYCFICMSICMVVCVYVCLSTSLYICLIVFFVYWYIFLLVCLPICPSVCFYIFLCLLSSHLPVSLYISWFFCLSVWLLAHFYVYPSSIFLCFHISLLSIYSLPHIFALLLCSCDQWAQACLFS